MSWALYNVLSGGVMLGAIFMATDYASSPVTHRGQIVFGIGCGLITVFIRYFGTYSGRRVLRHHYYELHCVAA